MRLYATDLELRLGEAIDKPPRTIRYHTARLLTELTLGRTLAPEESQRLYDKIRTTFPYHDSGYRYTCEDMDPPESHLVLGVITWVLREVGFVSGGVGAGGG